ncbi:hypothetical protein HDU87_005334 [Geranomyces variabilis]|uniref:Uncharacterized protein n=1 Tax=Geranomyces variabilis TaxID=109894 RepID=A0AAD5XL82_9FUNG|nr:hypothetical protein HDU87_005334 [Geranomyces variabilis]
MKALLAPTAFLTQKPTASFADYQNYLAAEAEKYLDNESQRRIARMAQNPSHFEAAKMGREKEEGERLAQLVRLQRGHQERTADVMSKMAADVGGYINKVAGDGTHAKVVDEIIRKNKRPADVPRTPVAKRTRSRVAAIGASLVTRPSFAVPAAKAESDDNPADCSSFDVPTAESKSDDDAVPAAEKESDDEPADRPSFAAPAAEAELNDEPADLPALCSYVAPAAEAETLDAVEADKWWTQYLNDLEVLRCTDCPVLRQQGRHLSELAEFFVADAALVGIQVRYGAKSYAATYEALVPAVGSSTIDILAQLPFLAWAAAAVTELRKTGKIFVPRKPWFGSVPPSLPAELVLAAATACHVEHHAGSTNAAEADTKFIGMRLVKDAVAFLAPNFTTCAEKRHHFTEEVKGSGRSDLVVAVSGGTFRNFATLIVIEFQTIPDNSPNSPAAHKDFCVAAAEAVIDSRSIISGLPIEKIQDAKLHIFLVFDKLIKCQVLGPSFDLDAARGGTNMLLGALGLIEYLRAVVFPDGEVLAALLKTWTTNRQVLAAMPKLPTKLPEVRSDSIFSPAKNGVIKLAKLYACEMDRRYMGFFAELFDILGGGFLIVAAKDLLSIANLSKALCPPCVSRQVREKALPGQPRKEPPQ